MRLALICLALLLASPAYASQEQTHTWKVRNTPANTLRHQSAAFTLASRAPKAGMVGFLRDSEAAGTLTSVAFDSARASRSLKMVANVDGIDAALDELINEADKRDKRSTDPVAGRCK